jgi:putative tryptophan/tyrosine transport system substrate-binding protein
MIDRRTFLAGTGAVLLAAPLVAEAQPTGRLPRIGVLGVSGQAAQVSAFRQGLEELGYVEGKTIVLELRWLEGGIERQPALVSELILLPVDVVVVGTTGAAISAKRLTTTVPIVTSTAGALVEAGVVASLARPGGNVTGLTNMAADLSAKRLDLLKEAVPRLSRVAALMAPYTPPLGEIFVRQTEDAARVVRVELQLLRVQDPADLDGAFQSAVRGRAGAMTILPNPFFQTHAGLVGGLALKHRLPMISGEPGVVEAGGLIQYAVDTRDMWRRAAGYVDKILKGTKPGDLPIQQPTKFELVINLKTAKALGLTIPPSLLGRADEIIQ